MAGAGAFWLCAMLCGCDVLLGLDTLQPNPPGDGDVGSRDGVDSPGAGRCAGTLQFGSPTKIVMTCTDFSIGGPTTSPTTAGTCYPSPTTPADATGPVSTPLSVPLVLPPNTVGNAVITPRLSPDTPEIFAREIDRTTSSEAIDWYHFASGTWSRIAQLQLPAGFKATNAGYISTPTSDSAPRSMLYAATTTGFDELMEDAQAGPGIWDQLVTHTISEFTAAEVVQPNLSKDGTRIVFVSDGDIYSTTRPGNTMMFTSTTTTLLKAVGNAVAPFLTDDCSGLYYSTVDGTGNYTLYYAPASGP